MTNETLLNEAVEARQATLETKNASLRAENELLRGQAIGRVEVTLQDVEKWANALAHFTMQLKRELCVLRGEQQGGCNDTDTETRTVAQD